MVSAEGHFDWNDFQIGFWHPFGPHGRETREQILARKGHEIQSNGWTLWSFQHRRSETLHLWLKVIEEANPPSVFVFCSDSQGALDPPGETERMAEYRPANNTHWLPIPETISILHPGKPLASGFKVRQIVQLQTPSRMPQLFVEWLDISGNWRSDALPTRGEYLVRRGGHARLRPVYAMLELDYPYAASLRR